jgi:hypothetical protein
LLQRFDQLGIPPGDASIGAPKARGGRRWTDASRKGVS